jgi:hypothetical protein
MLARAMAAAAGPSALLRRLGVPAALFVGCALVFVLVLGERRTSPSPDNHFVHLALSFLEGQLSVLGDRPPGNNDWALFEGRWYVSFPPFPAVVILPIVAIWMVGTAARQFGGGVAGAAPALLYVLLRALRERFDSGRRWGEDLALSLLFAFGTVFFFVAVQGAVWFAAHVVAVCLLLLYALFSLDARRPLLAGLMLGLCFMTRPNTSVAVLFFAIEALRVARRPDAPEAPEDALVWRKLWVWLRGVQVGPLARSVAVFAAPILVIGALAMWMNHARFHDPFEFGHRYLQIAWSARIERWGLFNYHYLAKNLAVFAAGLPWLSAQAPYITISRHGLALWLTTPNLLTALWPKRVNATMVGLFAASAAVCVFNLLYQNSGWIQFGYRFALDYMPFLFALLALSRRRFGPGFWLLALLAVAINTFGAITFDRAWQFYDNDPTQNVLFQRD